jgi:hypothetical protein
MSSLILVFFQRIYVLHIPRQSTIAIAHSMLKKFYNGLSRDSMICQEGNFRLQLIKL